MTNCKREINKDNIEKMYPYFLFFSFLLFYFVLGMLLSYNYDFLSKNNFLFDFDSQRVIDNMSNIFSYFQRISVHPLFVIIYQPIYFIVNGFIQSKIISILLISSFISSLSVFFIYKTISLFSNNLFINFLLSLLYGLTFSSIIFSAGIDLYNIATFFLILMWYFVSKKMFEGWNEYDDIIMIVFGITSIGITITNYVIFLVCCFVLLISKRINFKKTVLIFLSSITLIFLFSYLQNNVWQTTPVVTSLFTTVSNETYWMNFSITFGNFLNVIRSFIFNAIAPSKIVYGEIVYKGLTFGYLSKLNIICICIFLLFSIFICAKNLKINKYINIGLVLSIIFNFCLHIVYGNVSSFLYSMHVLYLIILFIGINYNNSINKEKIFVFLLLIFTIYVLLNNMLRFEEIINYCSNYLESSYYAQNFSFIKLILGSLLIIIFIMLCFSLIVFLTKKILFVNELSRKIFYIMLVVGIIIITECMFVSIKTITEYNRVLWMSVRKGEINYLIKNGSAAEISKYKSNLKSSERILFNNNYLAFIDEFPDEVNSYLEYYEEYKEFVDIYNTRVYNNFPNIDYYFFGLGNREKLMFKDNQLVYITDQELITQYDAKSYLIIPNISTVLIEDKNGEYVKIYENDLGVIILDKNGERIVEGTNSHIDIFSFEGEKYRNIKYTLYTEILFNITDGKILPNIMVYDDVWYRDAALACMVLKYTDNTDLLIPWLSSIERIYDRQNSGECEPDNLGELLYILSCSNNPNEELINNIEKEADRIAKNNPNGYYIFGRTDFNNHYLYQNMWYKLGMKSLGKESPFDYSEIATINDDYRSLVWWEDYKGDFTMRLDIYPYLSWANYHATNGIGVVYVSDRLYPLSWEQYASQADYSKMNFLDKSYFDRHISPTHVWDASEMLLFILDETGDLDIDVLGFYE